MGVVMRKMYNFKNATNVPQSIIVDIGSTSIKN